MRRTFDFLGSPKLTVYCLAFLMVLTFWGTLYQVNHGLFEAQQRFYNSYWIMIAGFIPFPGTQLVLAVLLMNLIVYLVKMLAAETVKPGIALIHLGILLLLLGGAITHHFAEESHLTLIEGEGSNVSASYHEWELAVWREKDGVRDVMAVDADHLKEGDVVRFEPLGLTVEAESYHRNCRAFQSAAPAASTSVLNRMGITMLQPARSALEPAENTAGGIFTVRPVGEDPYRVLLFGEDISPRPILAHEERYQLALRRKRLPLPITVRLLDFQREMHPGTSIARSFSSDIEVLADGIARPVSISMNKPLRHRGYTLYQASYSELPGGAESSTFAVAHNYGRLIPYVATSVVVLGMMVHFAAMLIRRGRGNGVIQ